MRQGLHKWLYACMITMLIRLITRGVLLCIVAHLGLHGQPVLSAASLVPLDGGANSVVVQLSADDAGDGEHSCIGYQITSREETACATRAEIASSSITQSPHSPMRPLNFSASAYLRRAGSKKKIWSPLPQVSNPTHLAIPRPGQRNTARSLLPGAFLDHWHPRLSPSGITPQMCCSPGQALGDDAEVQGVEASIAGGILLQPAGGLGTGQPAVGGMCPIMGKLSRKAPIKQRRMLTTGPCRPWRPRSGEERQRGERCQRWNERTERPWLRQ